MSEHEAAHLTDGQIISLSDGGGDAGAEVHIESCAECRERLAQWREARAWIAPVRAGSAAGAGPECPTMEELASYASGGRTGERTDAIAEHVAGCDHCAAILRDCLEGPPEAGNAATPLLKSSGREWRRRMAETFAAQRLAKPHYWKYAAAAAVFLVAAVSVTLWWNNRRSSDTAVLLARAYTAARPFAYRLPDAGYAPVRQQRGTGSAFDRPEALESAVAAIRRGLASQPRVPGLFALKGRAELLERDYEAAIESLTRATSAGDGDPDALADLATAYAVRGEAENRNIDYGHAMELFLQALKKRPADQRILFNLALTYERLWLVDEAIEAWQRFLRENPAAGWRQEAETHLAAMEKIKAEKKKADARVLRDPGQFLAAYGSGAAFDPLPWYEVFWMEWLPKEASDKTAASAARVIAAGFTRFGEFSLIESVDAPASATKDAGLALLASAMTANRRGHPGDALGTARDAAAKLDAAGMRAAAALARNEFVYATRWADRYRECLETSAVLLRSLGPRYPWLEGNAHLERAACLVRLGEDGPARIEIEGAEAQLSRLGLWPLASRAKQFKDVADGVSGNYGPIWDGASDGLRRYWTTRASSYREQAVQFNLRGAALGLGWRECSVIFYRASIRSAHDAGNGEIEASNRSGLAQLLHEIGDYPAEMHELEEVNRLLDHAGQSSDVRVLRWEAALRRVEADIATKGARDPLSELDRLASDAAGGEVAQRIDLEQARGFAFLARGDSGSAAAAFGRAIELNRTRTQSSASWVIRIPLIEAVSLSYRNLSQIELVQGDPAMALATWRQFRPSSSSARPSITMALLPAGIAIWTMDGNVVKMRWVEGDTGELRQSGEEFLALCASPTSSTSEIRRLGNRLYRGLLRPELQSMPPGTIVLNTESWLAAIPFGVLTDDTGGYLFRRFQFVQGYGPPAETLAGSITPASTALIVAAPGAVAPGQPPLPTLPAAEREAVEVAVRFPKSTVQRGATAEWLAANVPRANLFHFCGHGWANGGNGALILPPGPNGEPRFVTSANLSEQHWSRCQLVVLSACLTAAGETRGAVNNQSLVQALLGAGARRVVAARWSIDSEATRVLMDGFYARLVSGKSVPEALSGAAADVAASPGWSHPYFWAGFDVFGSA